MALRNRNVLTSRSPMANSKSDPDFAVFITFFFFLQFYVNVFMYP
jgi:hypothetical protein